MLDGDVMEHVASPCQCAKWSLKQRQWVYRGEGNASVVLALPQEKRIVRLSKIDQKLRRMDSDEQFLATSAVAVRTIEETLERLIFSRKILAPLLGARLVPPCHVYHVDLDEIEYIERNLESVRPAHRKHKKLAPVCHAIIGSDCTTSLSHPACSSHEPVYCVELKPKQGFLTKGHQHCPFCLNQFLKRQHGKIDVLSDYCPLDLFSGSWSRMLKAVVALTRTPQNNLRIFKDGNLVFADECQSNLQQLLEEWFCADNGEPDAAHSSANLPLHSLCTLVVQALNLELDCEELDGRRETDCGGGGGGGGDGQDLSNDLLTKLQQRVALQLPSVRSQVSDWFAEMASQPKRDHYDPCTDVAGVDGRSALPELCVLSKLLHVQKLGDVDFDQLYRAYDDLADRFYNRSFSYDNMRWTNRQLTSDWLQQADQLIDLQPCLEQSVRIVQRYRVSSTTRDCSIMITFQRVSNQKENVSARNHLCDLSGRWYCYRVSIIDLDPKPVSCVDKHRRRNRAMNDAFLLSSTSSANAEQSFTCQAKFN